MVNSLVTSKVDVVGAAKNNLMMLSVLSDCGTSNSDSRASNDRGTSAEVEPSVWMIESHTNPRGVILRLTRVLLVSMTIK
jgi:hypothetical protein